jgi:TetR/AcrR family transcriptional regulator, transcriptional repressor for nem operon
MGRVSRAVADQHRQQVVAAAARLLRERGLERVSVAEIMAEVGLTPGGFYRQFDSKDALAAEAIDEAFSETLGTLSEFTDRYREDHARARQELTDFYLSPESRDFPGSSCPSTAFGSDVSREEPTSPLRAAYVDGVRRFIEVLAGFYGDDTEHQDYISTLCTLVGALHLARATAGDPISDDILASARAHVLRTDN